MISNKPRIAFCFSGQARTLDQTYLFFQKNLFDAAKEQGFDYDVFCAVEDDEDVDKVNLLNPTKIKKIKSDEVSCIIEKNFGDLLNKKEKKFNEPRISGIRGHLQQMYKIQESMNLCKDGAIHYNLILRLRFDCYFLNKLNFKNILKDVEYGNSVIGNRAIRLFNRLWFLSDFFFIGNEGSMYKIFGSIFSNYGLCFSNNIFYFFPLNIISMICLFLLKFKRILPLSIETKIRDYFINANFVPEICLHKYMIIKKILIIKTHISTVLLRRGSALIRNDKKTKYEL